MRFFFTLLVACFLASSFLKFTPSDFLDEQLKFVRVREAKAAKSESLAKKLKAFNLDEKSVNVLLVAIKNSDELRVFVKHKTDKKFQLFETYSICARSGGLGPKRMQGDGQVPEGLYYIDRFNPTSNFYLSLGVSYPNAADLKKCGNNKPGGDIFIHGSCVTIGCLPMTDDKIKEIYLLAVYAKNNGQNRIPVYIFPFEMNELNMKLFATSSPHTQFWRNLKTGYDSFQQSQQALSYTIDSKGDYQIQ